MAVLKNKTQGNYTLVSQNIMRDQNLSLTERGMLLTLLSLPDNWHLTIRGLCQILPDGKERISKTLNSLIEKGYVTREQSRGDRGKFDSTNLEVHESPVILSNRSDVDEEIFKDTTCKTQVKSDISPCPEKRDTVKQDTENRDTGIRPQYNTNISKNQKVNIHRVCDANTLTDSEYQDLVLEFGKNSVDYQINRINDRGYKGCCNFTTIRKWCMERLSRSVVGENKNVQGKKNSFCNFPQRKDYDIEELERLLLCN